MSALHRIVTSAGHSAGSVNDVVDDMLNKTEKGRAELLPGQRHLAQRERALLLMADGRKPDAELFALFEGQGRDLAASLLSRGYLVDEASLSPPTPAVSADAFSGPRSMASARMFLFDLSERMFAPRDKAMAQRYRDALREARDLPAMLAVSREMVNDVERMAGSERADGITERLARLLPESALETP
ncbi:hypothetical protein [Hydrogenophaga laconesensis]|uniref:Uncharacterized protein n=1 Tax=Hydrogenophaga laconesensis TaxID=1805971 RepID=A0ABU1V5N8_9BURK|nr:hypothetical protein [Hydrogenophaga laconesensis]MDR7092771.1 hypothetical protein [Hydrogenophaga laconesensis]